MRTISTSHRHYSNFGRIYIENVLKFTQIVKALNFKHFIKMLVIIGPHFLNTLQARVIVWNYTVRRHGWCFTAPPDAEPPSLYYLYKLFTFDQNYRRPLFAPEPARLSWSLGSSCFEQHFLGFWPSRTNFPDNVVDGRGGGPKNFPN
jgi:hypothetical protein